MGKINRLVVSRPICDNKYYILLFSVIAIIDDSSASFAFAVSITFCVTITITDVGYSSIDKTLSLNENLWVLRARWIGIIYESISREEYGSLEFQNEMSNFPLNYFLANHLYNSTGKRKIIHELKQENGRKKKNYQVNEVGLTIQNRLFYNQSNHSFVLNISWSVTFDV